jgi:hypothetical protein
MSPLEALMPAHHHIATSLKRPLTPARPRQRASDHELKPSPVQQHEIETISDSPNRLFAHGNQSGAVRCVALARGLGQVADVFQMLRMSQRPHLRDRLTRLAAFTLGWMESNGGKIGVLTEAVIYERARQEALFKAGDLPFTCASLTADDSRKFTVLLEECGEVADAVQALEEKPTDRSRLVHLQSELVQVFAVCLGWLEALRATETQRTQRGGRP